MKVADLFAGVGGFSQGFINEGFDISFAVEYDKSIANSFKLNHSDTDVYSEDITTLDIKNMVLLI
jgi:DNA (cytosine-5)-methyltransferase 1